MNWDAIGAVGEIVGALAVVASLAYLAIQIRNQNREAKAATLQQVLESNAAAISQLQNPELAAIWLKGIDDFNSLPDVQRLRFVIYLASTMRSFENAFFQMKANRLDNETWDTLTAVVRDVASTAGFQEFLKIRKHHFRPEFIAYLENLEAGDYSYVKAADENDL